MMRTVHSTRLWHCRCTQEWSAILRWSAVTGVVLVTMVTGLTVGATGVEKAVSKQNTSSVDLPVATPANQNLQEVVKDVQNTSDEVGEEFTPVETLLDRVLTDKDHQIQAVILEVLEQLKKSGTWQDTRSEAQRVEFVDPNQVLLLALKKNLTLHRSSLDAARVKQAIQEAEAVFNPVFNLSLGQSAAMQYDRTVSAQVKYKNIKGKVLEHDPGIGGMSLYNAKIPGPHVNEIVFGGQKGTKGTVTEDVAVSTQQKGNPFLTFSETLEISQQLPWGPVLKLTQGITRKRTYDGVHGTQWDAPWGGSAGASWWIPLPFTRNFGHFAPQDVAVRQAGLAAVSADWVLRSQINQILLQADLSFWNLAQSVETLLVNVANEQGIKATTEATDRMYQHGRVTNYDKQQAEAELARARTLVAMGWKGVLDAGNALALLIEDDPDTNKNPLYLPMGFHARLQETTTAQLGPEVLQAIKAHPDMKARETALLSGALEVGYWENQVLPDISMNGKISQAQDNSVYGYKGVGDSMSHMLSPDNRTQKYGLAFSRAVGNRAVEANKASAVTMQERNRLNQQSQENSLLRAVMDANAELSGAKARLATAQKNEELARLALQVGRKRWSVKGDVSELELVLKQRELVQAQLSRVTARMDMKRAESRFFAGQGLLAKVLGHQNALNDFDRYRIQLLSDSGALPHMNSKPDKAVGTGS